MTREEEAVYKKNWNRKWRAANRELCRSQAKKYRERRKERLRGSVIDLTGQAVREIFWSKVDKSGACWIWKGYISGHGYGRFFWKGNYKPAHAVAYELSGSVIPEGMNIDHLCRNTSCVNPAHLEAVTPKVNVLRGFGPTAQNAKKTHCKRGHAFTPQNTRRTNGGRGCKRCNLDRKKLVRASLQKAVEEKS